MAFESAFLDLMPWTFTVKRFLRADGSSQGSYGGPSYSTATAFTFRGRLVLKHTRLMRTDGSEFEGDHILWGATTGTINLRDKLLSSGGSTYETLEVGRYPDQDGVHHTKLILRRTVA